tara:strand:+ start:24679 stop:25425 length:747 start_codon:yes stop_codon:yes gene_type:complete
MNQMLDKLQAGGVAVGASGTLDTEVRFLAGTGFDFLVFDTQHATMEIKQLAPPIASMRGTQAVPIIRVGANSAEQICYALDQGAKGVIAPMIESREQAQYMASACRYPPEGIRSNAGQRGEWGSFEAYSDYMQAVNENVLVIPMVETVEGLENLEAIVTTPGVNTLLIGPSDLSITLGMPLEYTNPKYLDVLDRIGSTCREHDVAPGMYFLPPGIEAQALISMGFQFFTVGWYGWAKAGIQAGLAEIR